MTTYAISDIHGRIAELNHLLDYIALGERDTVVFLGDYIDRGPDSKAVIERLIELEASRADMHFLLGNHEEMAMSAKNDRDAGNYWMRYGGEQTLASYPDGIPAEHWEFMSRLKPYMETPETIFVHAGLEADLPMERQNGTTLRWGRLRSALHHSSGKRIYCGHSKQAIGYPALLGDARCIECADWLTAIDANSDQVYQVHAAGTARSYNLQELRGA